MVVSPGRGAAVKKSVMRRLLLSVSGGGGGSHGSRSECIRASSLRWLVIWSRFSLSWGGVGEA